MAVEVLTGVAPHWADHVGSDVPIHASEPWIAATSHRLTKTRLTFLAAQDGQSGGLQATVVDDPATDEMINLYRTLLADPLVWKFPAQALAPRGALRADLPPVADWLPHLVVLYPGFDSFVAADGGPTPALAGALVDAAVSWAVGQGMKAVSFPYVRAGTVSASALAERGFHAIPLTYRSKLRLRGDFGDFLASLSRNGRFQVTKERRRLAERGVTTRRCSFDESWPDLLALRCDLVERYGQRANVELETTNMQRLRDCFGTDRLRLYCSFLDDRLVGFTLFVVWRDSWYAAYTGTYDEPSTRAVYFDHFCYAPVADAIEEGVPELDMGIGAWEGKRRRGCHLTEVDLWVRALDPGIERSVGVAGEAMRREVGWVPKEEPAAT